MNARRRAMAILSAVLVSATGSRRVLAQPKVARVGFLSGDSPSSNPHRVRAFREGLHELGYVEGRNLVIEYRWADGRFERLPDLAAELVRIPVDVIVAVGDPVIFAAKNATASIPIVIASVGDPIGRGFVASLGRPGGNVTGVSNFAAPMMGKWLELLKEILPALSQTAVLRNAANATHPLFWAEAQKRAPALGIRLQDVQVRNAEDLEKAFASIVDARSGAVVVLPDPLPAGLQVKRVAELALSNHLPAMCTFREQAEAGALFAYGPDLTANYHRAAFFVDKILKGTKPSELPVEQPTKFVSVVNLRTARQLGIAIPPTVTVRVDEIIQ